jgi:hypothetical protein
LSTKSYLEEKEYRKTNPAYKTRLLPSLSTKVPIIRVPGTIGDQGRKESEYPMVPTFLELPKTTAKGKLVGKPDSPIESPPLKDWDPI